MTQGSAEVACANEETPDLKRNAQLDHGDSSKVARRQFVGLLSGRDVTSAPGSAGRVALQIVTEEFEVDLGSGLRWGEVTVLCL